MLLLYNVVCAHAVGNAKADQDDATGEEQQSARVQGTCWGTVNLLGRVDKET
jgi:hypothetical protein